MSQAAVPADEPRRLRSLRATGLLDSPLEERFERITRLAQRLMQTPIAAISLVDAERQWFKSIQGLDVTETSRAAAFCAHTILEDDVVVVRDARGDPRFADNPLVTGDPNIVFYAGCPIRTPDGSKIGSLCLIDRRLRDLSAGDIDALRDFARLAEEELAASFRHAADSELLADVEAVRRAARVDALTRVWNREAIFEALDAEIARARRAGIGIGVIMGDLDHFKQVNDTLGHAGGDAVLRQAARRMLAAIRDVDALGRYGGEEFLIVLGPCESAAAAADVAERVRARIAGDRFEAGPDGRTVTMSLGVAFALSARGLRSEALVDVADGALYRAKQAGRNQVVCLSATGETAGQSAA
jgi:diguanylate cyclase (GGDEF)-like protein